jgi:trimeric autotransporter adhesin
MDTNEARIPERFVAPAGTANAGSLPGPKVLPALLALVLSALSLGGCGGAYSTPSQARLSEIFVTSGSLAAIPVAGTVQFVATGTYLASPTESSFKDLTNSATWSTSDPAVATVNKGLVTGTGIGSVTITATFNGKSGSTKVVVGLTPSITITPIDTNVFSLSAKEAEFAAIATYSDGSTMDLSDLATWTSSPKGILSFYIYTGGHATFIATGTTTITATFATGEAPTKKVTVVP